MPKNRLYKYKKKINQSIYIPLGNDNEKWRCDVIDVDRSLIFQIFGVFCTIDLYDLVDSFRLKPATSSFLGVRP